MAANEWWAVTKSEDSFYMHGAMGFAASFAPGGGAFGTGIGRSKATGMRQGLFYQPLKLGTAVGKALLGLVRGACHAGRARGVGSLLHLAAMILAEAPRPGVSGHYPQPCHVP